MLRARFPGDVIEPVPKGEFGGDVLHRVLGPAGQTCGTILFESKRTKNWTDAWLAKLRGDQRAAGADVAMIVSSALPQCEGLRPVDAESPTLGDGCYWRTRRSLTPSLRLSAMDG